LEEFLCAHDSLSAAEVTLKMLNKYLTEFYGDVVDTRQRSTKKKEMSLFSYHSFKLPLIGFTLSWLNSFLFWL